MKLVWGSSATFFFASGARAVISWVPAPSQIGGLSPLSRAKTPYLPTYCGRQPPGSVPHLPTYSQAAQRSEKIPVSPL